MDYKEIENWIRENITKNGNVSLHIFSKEEKIFESPFGSSQEQSELINLNGFLKKIGKSLTKVRQIKSVFWFKINLIDNALSDLVGLGKITDLNDLELMSSLIMYDKADQNGDVIVGIFDTSKGWLIKLTNDRDNNRVYIRLYGKGKIIELLKNKANG
ncbi:hypothetical protein [Aquimarina sp. SS2-1]|uniref:hypothetical protein n=1 Tax=Aquimarina besae TaxID=3342247 RepID=UPI0036716DEF